MPLRLVAPRKGRSPNWTIKGTYLKRRINDQSTGTSDKTLARQILKAKEREIERDILAGPQNLDGFSDAAHAYLIGGGDPRFIKPLIAYFGARPVRTIDQVAIDTAAAELYPDASPATRNRQCYTPISAVLKHVGIDQKLRRPKGGDGNKIVDWLRPEQAFAMLDAATALDREFHAVLYVFLYTGMRLSELLNRRCDDLHLSEATLFVPRTKNGKPRRVHLPAHVVAVLANHPRGADRPGERLFRFHKSGRLYELLNLVAEQAGVTLPRRSAFHLLRHTWATWMRRHAGMDARGLVDTGAWDSIASANRYIHNDVTEQARMSDNLPVPKGRAG